jgi:predicted small secreted protein
LTVGARHPKSTRIELHQTGRLTMRKLIVFAAATAALLVAACNTVQGVGRDIQAAGHAVTTTAEDAKH